MSTFFVQEFKIGKSHPYWAIVSRLSSCVAANLPGLSPVPNVSQLDPNKFGLAFYQNEESEYPVLRLQFQFDSLDRLQSWRITNSSAIPDNQKEALTYLLAERLKPFGTS